MRRFAQIALLACLSALAGAAFAFDNGQYENVPPDIRAWFKGVIAPNGVPCCDISDGHRTEYDFREGAYWVPIEGQWIAVPERAVIRDRGNPVGEAVVWYVHHRGSIIISCFAIRGATKRRWLRDGRPPPATWSTRCGRDHTPRFAIAA